MMMVNRRGGGAGGCRCQDCGNQSKKDCVYMRCRTCCKSRGYECQTHVKSTWIPLSRRRRLLLRPTHPTTTTTNPKRYRHNPHDLSPPPLPPGGGGGGQDDDDDDDDEMENEDLPSEVNMKATFKCVRVSSSWDENEVHQYAYQTAVNIGGHLFKGILYDQGSSNSNNSTRPRQQQIQTSSNYSAYHNQPFIMLHHHHQQQQQQKTTADPSNNHHHPPLPTTATTLSSYPTPFNAFMPGC